MRPIDADALINRMYHDAFETDTDMQKWDSGCWIRYKMFENAIDEQPTIEPKQGRWIVLNTTVTAYPVYWNEEQKEADKLGAGIKEHCECSACGWKTSFIGWKKKGVDKPFNFCPNCGAKMKGADDEDIY